MISSTNPTSLKQMYFNAKNEAKQVTPQDITKASFPIARTNTENRAADNDTLCSQLKGWYGFDIGLKTIGLAYGTAKRSLNSFRKIPNDLSKVPTLSNRFFTPNKLGSEIGKVIPDMLKNPLATLRTTVGKVAAEDGIKVVANTGGFYSTTLKPLIKLSGATFMMVFEMIGEIGNISKAFKKSVITGVKQVAKSITKSAINAAAYCGGEIVGASAGAAFGAALGKIISRGNNNGAKLGAQIGGWIGGMTGGCSGSYYSNKFVKSVIKPEVNTEEPKALTTNA
jgi:hypothetical protein